MNLRLPFGLNLSRAPQATRKERIRARFDGAGMGRSLRGYTPPLAHINTLLASGGTRLLARIRDMEVNNAHIARAARMWPAYAVGVGIMPAPRIADDGARKANDDLWWRWTDEADFDGATDFYGLQSLAAREAYVGGEAFVLREEGTFAEAPLALRVLGAEMLPFDAVGMAANGNIIRTGIEMDPRGRRVAYHFYGAHPGDVTEWGRAQLPRIRIPAEDVCHIYDPLQAGQLRGVSTVAAAVLRLHLLTRYDEAELERQRTAALFAGFVTRSVEDLDDNAIAAVFGTREDEDEGEVPALEPGAMAELEPGEDVKFSDPPQLAGAFEAFQYRSLTAIAAALDLPYHTLTNDPVKANFGSTRAVQLDFKRRVDAYQNNVMIFKLCRRVRQWFDLAAQLAGADMLDSPVIVDWVPPAWDWIDPLKDALAEEKRIENETLSKREAVERQGRPDTADLPEQ